MHRNLLNHILLLVGTAVFVSCGGADKHAIAVPKDAAVVIHINAPSLSSKLSWAEIQATNWYKDLHAEAGDDTTAQQLLTDPESSGINLQQDLVMFVKRRGRSGYIAFEGTLKDASAFEAFMKKVDKGAVSKKDGDMNILQKEDNIITWNSSRFIILGNAPATPSPFTGRSSFDPDGGPSANLPADSLIKFAKELYNLDSDNSLFTDKRFADLIKEPGDVHMWISAAGLYSGGLGEALSMLKLSVLTEGNVTAASINFENGKIAMKAKSYYNQELGKLYEKYKMKNFDAAVLNRIPSQNIVGVFSMNYPPEGLHEFLKVIGVDGLWNSALAEVNYSMEEFVKANKGEVMVALTDLEMKQQPLNIPGMEGMEGMNQTVSRPDFKVLFATSVNDRPAFEKLVSTLKSKIGELPGAERMPEIKYSMNDNWFAASNSEEYVNKFLAGGNNNWPLANKLAGSPIIFYVDLQKCMKPMVDTSGGDGARLGQYILGESLKMWESAIGTGGNLENGAMHGSFEVNLVDKNTNALKQLNQYIDKLNSSRKRAQAF
jgi:hypothetical protein